MNLVSAIRVARPVAPDDLDFGTYVVILRAIYQFVRIPSGDDAPDRRIIIRTVTMLPDDDSPSVLRVQAVCLPYVLADSPKGSPQVLDTRRYTLGAVPAVFGDAVFARFRCPNGGGPSPPDGSS